MILLRPKRPHQLLIQLYLCQGRNFIFLVYTQDIHTKNLVQLRQYTYSQPHTISRAFFLSLAYILSLQLYIFESRKEQLILQKKTALQHLIIYHIKNLCCLSKWNVITFLDSRQAFIKWGYERIIVKFYFPTNCCKSICISYLTFHFHSLPVLFYF